MPILRERLEGSARFQQGIREFFTVRGFVEVDTPTLCCALIPEAAIEVFETEILSPGGGRKLYLAPSPELWMKRLIAAGSGDIFQISRSFRNGDHGSPVHNPEFRLLEWYSVHSAYLDCIPVAEALLGHLLACAKIEPVPESLSPPFRRMTMGEAFRRFAGVELADCLDRESLVKKGERLGLMMPDDPSWEEAFHVIFLSRVEPNLPRDKPLVLLDYPALIPTTARRKRGTSYAERWELFINGVEIANCYSEETDPGEVMRFLKGEEERKKGSQVRHPTDAGFAALFDAPFPPCAGVALGVDRLEMAIRGEASLEGVILFPFSAMFDAQSSTGRKGST